MATMKIKSMHLTQFKGIVDKTFTFDGKSVDVRAENGSGKTTIADAYFWVFADRDTTLGSNPKIRPNNMAEALPRVEIVLDLNGVEVTAVKQQKKTESKPDANGLVKVALTNSYEVNSVPKSEKDFKEYFECRDIDLSLFMMMAHPDAFTFGINDKKKRDFMRNVLFGMCSNYNDYDLAAKIPGLEILASRLQSYKLDEIESMENATMRHANEMLEQIPFRIVGMEESKVAGDYASLEAEKKSLIAEIDSLKAGKGKANELEKQLTALTNEITAMRAELADYKSGKSLELMQQQLNLKSALDAETVAIADRERTIAANQKSIVSENMSIATQTKILTKARTDYAEVKAQIFDEEGCICPNCGQSYPEDKKTEMRENFERTKVSQLEEIITKGNTAKENVTKSNELIEQLNAEIAELEKANVESKAKCEQLQQQIKDMPAGIDFSKDSHAAELQAAIDAKSLEITSFAEPEEDIASGRETELRAKLSDVDHRLGQVYHNKQIDEQIKNLQEQQVQFEQTKAKCEQILKDQIPRLRKYKNDLLSNEINSHFKLVKFKLFDFQKNGTYIDVCEPMIDGKSFSSESNGALKVLAKLDICSGLQNFFKTNIPVFCDGFESVTANTEIRIVTDYQLIKLRADSAYKEITITEG